MSKANPSQVEHLALQCQSEILTEADQSELGQPDEREIPTTISVTPQGHDEGEGVSIARHGDDEGEDSSAELDSSDEHPRRRSDDSSESSQPKRLAPHVEQSEEPTGGISIAPDQHDEHEGVSVPPDRHDEGEDRSVELNPSDEHARRGSNDSSESSKPKQLDSHVEQSEEPAPNEQKHQPHQPEQGDQQQPEQGDQQPEQRDQQPEQVAQQGEQVAQQGEQVAQQGEQIDLNGADQSEQSIPKESNQPDKTNPNELDIEQGNPQPTQERKATTCTTGDEQESSVCGKMLGGCLFLVGLFILSVTVVVFYILFIVFDVLHKATKLPVDSYNSSSTSYSSNSCFDMILHYTISLIIFILYLVFLFLTYLFYAMASMSRQILLCLTPELEWGDEYEMYDWGFTFTSEDVHVEYRYR